MAALTAISVALTGVETTNSSPTITIGSECKKRVVILGGGFGGGTAAMLLQEHFDVTLVDKKPYFENICALYRYLTDSSMPERNRLPHGDYAPSVTVKVGAVDRVMEKAVVLEDQETIIPFDYLIVATGSHYQSLPVLDNDDPCTLPVISLTDGDACEEEHHRLTTTSGGALAVVGGGASGVEVAAELAEKYPDKTIHFIYSGDVSLSRSAPEAREVSSRHFSTLSNVHLWPGERAVGISDADNGSVVARYGTRVTGISSVFLCVGFKPNTEFMKGDMSKLLDERGFVLVNEHMQSPVDDSVFAIGDVASVNENKLVQNAFRHATVASENILKLHFSSSDPNALPLTQYSSEERRVCVMLGRSNAVVVGPSGVESGEDWAKRKQGFSLSAAILPKAGKAMAAKLRAP